MTLGTTIQSEQQAMKKSCFGWVLGLATVALASSFASSPVSAYEEVTVSDGGTLTGIVKLEGTVPKPKGYNLTTLPDPFYCGRISDGEGWRILQPFNVGPGGEFREVVVYLEGIEKGKAFAEKEGLPVPSVYDRRAGRSVGDGRQHGPGHARHSGL